MTRIARSSPLAWLAVLAALLVAPLGAQAAGQVQVRWIEPEKYADAEIGRASCRERV